MFFINYKTKQTFPGTFQDLVIYQADDVGVSGPGQPW